MLRKEDKEDTVQTKGNKKRRAIRSILIILALLLLLLLSGIRIYPSPFQCDRIKLKQNAAKTQIVNFKTALEMYHKDNGAYPTTEQGPQALVEKPSIPPEPKNYNPDGYLAGIPLDPWGNEYIYHSPDVYGMYSIISYGADGVSGGEGEDRDVECWRLSE